MEQHYFDTLKIYYMAVRDRVSSLTKTVACDERMTFPEFRSSYILLLKVLERYKQWLSEVIENTSKPKQVNCDLVFQNVYYYTAPRSLGYCSMSSDIGLNFIDYCGIVRLSFVEPVNDFDKKILFYKTHNFDIVGFWFTSYNTDEYISEYLAYSRYDLRNIFPEKELQDYMSLMFKSCSSREDLQRSIVFQHGCTAEVYDKFIFVNNGG